MQSLRLKALINPSMLLGLPVLCRCVTQMVQSRPEMCKKWGMGPHGPHVILKGGENDDWPWDGMGCFQPIFSAPGQRGMLRSRAQCPLEDQYHFFVKLVCSHWSPSYVDHSTWFYIILAHLTSFWFILYLILIVSWLGVGTSLAGQHRTAAFWLFAECWRVWISPELVLQCRNLRSHSEIWTVSSWARKIQIDSDGEGNGQARGFKPDSKSLYWYVLSYQEWNVWHTVG